MTYAFDRRPGEQTIDYVERLLVEPLFGGATAAEVALHAGCKVTLVHTVRRDREAGAVRGQLGEAFLERARETARHIGWTRDDGGLLEMMHAALAELELAACREGRCRHGACDRRSAQEAPSVAVRPETRPAHETRHHEAPRRPQLTAGARPADQSRGALADRRAAGGA